jgi:anti-sigma factor RsiW
VHPDAERTLIAYATGGLAEPERARVTAHLAACATCRRTVEESRAVLDGLAGGGPEPPALDEGRYRAELRARRQARGRERWWARPLPALVVAGVATAGLVLALQGLHRPGELAPADERALGARLPLLQQYRVVERLDLLEDLDAIRHLDGMGGTR